MEVVLPPHDLKSQEPLVCLKVCMFRTFEFHRTSRVPNMALHYGTGTSPVHVRVHRTNTHALFARTRVL
uniref:Uncharacterized protein n=1 Tax=Setaria viridis TaxID=4556 RepID=A0A4U6TUC1_SETVI|nr:hypothetical protein SEVIR_7G196350v2 [Setaria viridis]